MENLWPDAFPTLKNLTSSEILTIWDSVSEWIRQHLAQDRGVRLLGIGTFYVLKDYMHTVNSEVSIVRRPMFHMSKVVADECNLSYTEEDVPADVTVVPLRCEELSVCAQLPFTTVQCCVYETVTSFFRATSKRQDTDFVFKSIGILSIRNREVTMRFFDYFLLTVDGTGKLLEALLSTPGRRHLVVSDRESLDFHMGPEGVFLLPQFDFTLPSEKEALECPSVAPLKATEDREEEEEEEKKEKEEEEGDKQIKTDAPKMCSEESSSRIVPESPPTERLLSRGRQSWSLSTLSGLKKGKGWEGKGRRSPGRDLAMLPTAIDWERGEDCSLPTQSHGEEEAGESAGATQTEHVHQPQPRKLEQKQLSEA
ncbi:coiled-coil domain-containing protein 81-like [Accipiter gentilis]|uniref:coiled-coil domain-containing protein 81-like n=1 Tax=Astur gentilis TaxID=8957 RepID=UPI00210F7310|nr:coiled-coil domain-containing protein 81-like [Accipiter gentilis]